MKCELIQCKLNLKTKRLVKNADVKKTIRAVSAPNAKSAPQAQRRHQEPLLSNNNLSFMTKRLYCFGANERRFVKIKIFLQMKM